MFLCGMVTTIVIMEVYSPKTKNLIYKLLFFVLKINLKVF